MLFADQLVSLSLVVRFSIDTEKTAPPGVTIAIDLPDERKQWASRNESLGFTLLRLVFFYTNTNAQHACYEDLTP